METSPLLRRLFALLIDWAILLVPVAVAGHAFPVLGGLIILFFYAPFLESSRLQATIGKHLLGIQVTGLSGERISFGTACLRLVMKLLSFPLLGYCLAIFTRRSQAFHDLVAGTVVVCGRREMSIADAWIEQVRSVFGGTGGDPA